VESVAFSPDGGLLLTGSFDRTARLWEMKSGSLLHTLEGHTGWVTCVAFSPDGRFTATGDVNGWVLFWQTSDMGKLMGLYVTSFNVGAIYWQDATHVVLADRGGLRGLPYFYHLKLVGM